MIKSTGLDIVEISRIEKNIESHGDRFIDKILSTREKELYSKRVDKKQYLAGRFAAKEAVIKALGVYLKDKPMLPEIEIVNSETGQPELCLAEKYIPQLNNAVCFISISHEKSVAAAMAIFSEE
ncbi:MAG: holo-[acyl-carrier-protein] synthase [Calditrichaeota bacterium]|nr:MAG: holo-[acyl-carrier-protein] synthase [Calditrichota bacterium]